MNIALFSSIALLFALLVFTLASVPLLVLGHDTPLDARVISRLFNLGYLAVAILAAACAVIYAVGVQVPFAAGMACVAVLALAVRHRVLQRMDALAGGIGSGDSAAISRFRRLHLTGIALNVFQLAAIGAGLTQLAKRGTAPEDQTSLPRPKRALTGRDAAGKSVFKSFEVTPQVVAIDSNPGLTFYELYSTEGVPALTGQEPDPMLRKTRDFPGPGGTNFRLISYPPRRALTYKPPPGVTFESALAELDEKIPGMGRHFDRDAPGMHTTDTVDYGIVVRGEMTLELDDGQQIHLRQGDCVIQNGTRHRWRNPLDEPCLMAFISVGGKPREARG